MMSLPETMETMGKCGPPRNQEANFKNVLFCPNSTLNIRKSHKIYGGKALYFRSYQPKTSRSQNF